MNFKCVIVGANTPGTPFDNPILYGIHGRNCDTASRRKQGLCFLKQVDGILLDSRLGCPSIAIFN
jgi:hypothetical protein